jgi:hypothetical protein
MKRLLSRLLLCALISLGGPVHAEQIALIAHRDSPQRELNRQEAADLFLGKRQSLDGQSLNPIDINDDQLQAHFYNAIADMSLTRLKAYWARLVFSGQGRPPPKIALNNAVDRINRDSAAVTYVYANAIPRDAKVLLRLQ